jgi:hypothetical protein
MMMMMADMTGIDGCAKRDEVRETDSKASGRKVIANCERASERMLECIYYQISILRIILFW